MRIKIKIPPPLLTKRNCICICIIRIGYIQNVRWFCKGSKSCFSNPFLFSQEQCYNELPSTSLIIKNGIVPYPKSPRFKFYHGLIMAAGRWLQSHMFLHVKTIRSFDRKLIMRNSIMQKPKMAPSIHKWAIFCRNEKKWNPSALPHDSPDNNILAQPQKWPSQMFWVYAFL